VGVSVEQLSCDVDSTVSASLRLTREPLDHPRHVSIASVKKREQQQSYTGFCLAWPPCR
jgi:hypothetical protein